MAKDLDLTKDILISEAFEKYRLEYIVYKNQSDRTEEMHNLALKNFLQFAGDLPVSEITFDTIRKWKDDLSRKLKPNSVRGYIIKMRVVMKFLNLHGFQTLNYQLIGIPKRDETVADFLEVEEVKELIRAAFRKSAGYSKFKRYRNRAMIALFFSAGLRVSELCSINRSQIKDGFNEFTIIGKGNKARLCFIDDQTHKYIDEYLKLRDDISPALFVSEQNKWDRISKSVPELVIKNCARKAGIRLSICPRTLRHSFATDLLRNNANIVHVKEFLGHANINTTMTYTHVINEDLRQVHIKRHSTISI